MYRQCKTKFDFTTSVTAPIYNTPDIAFASSALLHNSTCKISVHLSINAKTLYYMHLYLTQVLMQTRLVRVLKGLLADKRQETAFEMPVQCNKARHEAGGILSFLLKAEWSGCFSLVWGCRKPGNQRSARNFDHGHMHKRIYLRELWNDTVRKRELYTHPSGRAALFSAVTSKRIH